MLIELDTLSLKFMWKNKHVIIAKKFLRKNIYKGELALENIKTYYKVSLIKTVWYRSLDRQTSREKKEVRK